MAISEVERNKEGAIRTPVDIGTQTKRIAKAIVAAPYNFYDPFLRQMLPPFAELLDLIWSSVGVLVNQSKDAEPLPSLEEAIVDHFARRSSKEVSELVGSFSIESLDNERKDALYREHYTRNTNNRLLKLKGFLLLNADDYCVQAYRCVSLLYALSTFPVRAVLFAFADNNPSRRGDTMYQAIPGIKILSELIKFAELVHRFVRVQWVGDLVDILGSRVARGMMNEDGLRKSVESIQQIGEDNILQYIIQHIKKDPSAEITTEVFDADIFERYFVHIQRNISSVDSKYQEYYRKRTVRLISQKLFGHLPHAKLTIYTDQNRLRLEEQEVYYFSYAKSIEYIVLFIDYTFQMFMVDSLQIPLLLKAVWYNTAEQRGTAQLLTDMKDLRGRISLFDKEIISLFGSEKLLFEVLNNCGLIEEKRKKQAIDTLVIIDLRFAEMIRIFRGIAKQTVQQLRKVLRDKMAAKKSVIRNWTAVNGACAAIEYKLTKAISVLEDCVTLVEVTYRAAR